MTALYDCTEAVIFCCHTINLIPDADTSGILVDLSGWNTIRLRSFFYFFKRYVLRLIVAVIEYDGQTVIIHIDF